MKQGEIWHERLDPVIGSEQAGFRPVVILSGNLLNTHLQVVLAAPLTSKIKGYKGNPILTPTEKNGLKVDSEVMIFHLRSISKQKLKTKIGEVEKKEIKLAIETLNDILTF
ncbi:type II toxin-antitoxin system PemK/MazF family toxin [Algoriphagus hitonicola]|uniref:mRNA interferase n=1 Tax=Algoriphagus hitonicola TaxID=435880 RepID=A0A1I2VJU0_9BACT|nr:type II toxin-antitoxin system PemK/MazF family toxin [Algoriphagus hitonicola]SFG87471.1 mRNA interferase MazF [Algoriphagus hitonicola]